MLQMGNVDMTGFLSFLRLTSIPIHCVCDGFLFISSSTKGHLGCLHLLVMKKNVLCKLACIYLRETAFLSILSDV